MVATKTRSKPRKRAGAKKRTSKAPRSASIAGTNDDPRQTYLGDTEPLKFPEIDALVARFGDLTTSREKAKEMADEVRDKIVAAMKENNVTTYRSSGKLVQIIEGQTICKIKKAADH